MTLQLPLSDQKRMYFENKMAANYRDKTYNRRPSAETPEHHPNIYMNLDPPNFSLPTPFKYLKELQGQELTTQFRHVKQFNHTTLKLKCLLYLL